MNDHLGTAAFTDKNGNPVETDNQDNWNESDNQDTLHILDLLHQSGLLDNPWVPGGIWLHNPNTGVFALVRPDEGRVGAFRPSLDNKVLLSESDIESISLTMSVIEQIGMNPNV